MKQEKETVGLAWDMVSIQYPRHNERWVMSGTEFAYEIVVFALER